MNSKNGLEDIKKTRLICWIAEECQMKKPRRTGLQRLYREAGSSSSSWTSAGWTRPAKAERPEASRATADGRGRGRGNGSESERPQMKQQFVWHKNSFVTPLLILMGQKKREVKVG